MAGKGQYLVGANQAYRSLSEALSDLQSDQGLSDFTAQQEIVIVEDGNYEGVRIEPGSLSPTPVNRLLIRGSTDTRAIITETEAIGSIGVYVGSNVPNVSVQMLWFAKLTNAITYGVNSHRGIVDKCHFQDAGRNAAIWFYQADECMVSNSMIVNGLHGIAAQQVRNVAILNNTIYDSGGSEAEPHYLVFLDLQESNRDYAYIYNNIFYSRGSHGLLAYQDQIPYIKSNYNDWYFPSAEVLPSQKVLSSLVEYRERLDTGTRRHFAVRLRPINPQSPGDTLSWQFQSGQDVNSISDDPTQLVKPNWSYQTPPAIQGRPANYSMAVVGGAFLCGDTMDLLPDWVDDEILCKDIIGDNRGPFVSYGAYQVYTLADYDPDDPFADFDPEDCNPEDPLDKVVEQYRSSVPVWRPKIHRGFFFSRDMRYHLFAKKQGLFLKDAYRTTFALSSLVEEVTEVMVSGEDVTETATWEVDGYTFTLHHHEVTTSNTDVVVNGLVKYWDDDAQGFDHRVVEHRWMAEEGLRTYVLPTNPVPGQPIIVTDDLIEPSDTLSLAQEFGTRYDPERDQTYIEFGGAKNLWANPDFAYTDTGSVLFSGDFTGDVRAYVPEEHEYYMDGDLGVARRFNAGATHPEHAPLRAGHALLMGTGESWVGQRVLIDPEEAYTLSAYGAAVSYGETGQVDVTVEFQDWDHQTLSSYGPFTMQLEPASSTDLDWQRFGLQLAASADTTPGRPPLSSRLEVINDRVPIPSTASRAFIRFHRGGGNAPITLDAVQLEKGYQATLFTRIPRGEDLTIEYETKESLFYEIEDLNLQPMRHAFNSGFIAITPASARTWDKDAAPYTTTLSDHQWGWGRVNLLPWAKTDGYNKYHRRVWFSTVERRGVTENIAVAAEMAYPKTIRVSPSAVFAAQGSIGSIFAIETYDEEGNPYAFERGRTTISDNTGEFPGYLNRTEWGFPVELGQTIESELNEAGAQVLRWIPPTATDIQYQGNKPTIESTTGGLGYGYVRTLYRPQREGHGTPVLEDQFGTEVGLEGAAITGAYNGRYHSDGYTRITLPQYPVPGSVTLYVSDTGTYDLEMQEQFYPPVFDHHFDVDYETKTISIPGIWDQMIKVGYQPRLAWLDSRFERRIYFAKEALDQVTGDITVSYDAKLDIYAEALHPRGQDYKNPIYARVDAIAQHTKRDVQWQ